MGMCSQRCISWTVEWVAADNSRTLGACLETQSLAAAFAKHAGEAPPAKRRKVSKKNGQHREDGACAANPGVHDPSPTTGSSSPPLPATDKPAPFFYLHIPNPHTPAPVPTLLPLSPAQPLATLLRNRLVREFPTVYVLDDPPDELPRERYALQRDGTAEVGRLVEGEQRKQGEVDGGDGDGKEVLGAGRERKAVGMGMGEGAGREGNGKEGDAEEIEGPGSPECQGGADARGRDDTVPKAAAKPGEALATGNDELSWIMREVI